MFCFVQKFIQRLFIEFLLNMCYGITFLMNKICVVYMLPFSPQAFRWFWLLKLMFLACNMIFCNHDRGHWEWNDG